MHTHVLGKLVDFSVTSCHSHIVIASKPGVKLGEGWGGGDEGGGREREREKGESWEKGRGWKGSGKSRVCVSLCSWTNDSKGLPANPPQRRLAGPADCASWTWLAWLRVESHAQAAEATQGRGGHWLNRRTLHHRSWLLLALLAEEPLNYWLRRRNGSERGKSVCQSLC